MAMERFEEIVNYIPKPLYECLEQLKDERDLNSVTQAVNVVLEDYFGLDSHQNVTSKPLTPLVEDLRGEVADLKQQVSEIQHSFIGNPTARLVNPKEQGELLSQQQLAERLEVDSSTIEQHKTDGKEFVEWSRSKDPERVGWRYTKGNLFRRV